MRHPRPSFVALKSYKEVEALYKATVGRTLEEMARRGMSTVMTVTFPGNVTDDVTLLGRVMAPAAAAAAAAVPPPCHHHPHNFTHPLSVLPRIVKQRQRAFANA